MGTEIAKSTRAELIAAARTSIAAIENAPKASKRDAARACDILIGSYPQQKAHTPEVYMRQVRNMLSGVPLGVVMQLVDAKRGILSECVFLPTLAEIAKWLNQAMRPTRDDYRRHIGTLETLDYEAVQLSPAERERMRGILQDLTEAMRERHGSPVALAEALDTEMTARFEAVQCHDPEKAARMRAAAMAYLDAMRPRAEETVE